MENMLVPEIFFSMQKMLKQMECRMLIGSIFIGASIVAVTLTTLCLIFNGIWKFFSAKRSNSNPEGIELGEVRRIENGEEASSIDSSERASSAVVNGEESELGDEECEQRDGVSRRFSRAVQVRDASRRDPERDFVHGRGRVRDTSRGDRERESRFAIDLQREFVCEAVRVRGAPSLPPFKNTGRLKLSTLVLILYSTCFKFLSLYPVLRLTGNVLLLNSISIIMNSFLPLLLIRMGQDILSFLKEIVNRGELN